MKNKTAFAEIKENTWLSRSWMEFGWGNGYVHIPEGHPWFGKDYNDIEGVEINGGLTYSEMQEGMWVIGFDTAHSWDMLSVWPKEAVQAEADRLLEQVNAAATQTVTP